jgi:hypothetical protein
VLPVSTGTGEAEAGTSRRTFGDLGPEQAFCIAVSETALAEPRPVPQKSSPTAVSHGPTCMPVCATTPRSAQRSASSTSPCTARRLAFTLGRSSAARSSSKSSRASTWTVGFQQGPCHSTRGFNTLLRIQQGFEEGPLNPQAGPHLRQQVHAAAARGSCGRACDACETVEPSACS